MAAWHQIDSATRKDMLDWLNLAQPDASDKRRLAKLYTNGQFISYACGHCGEKVKRGYPCDWSEFQGVCQDEGMGQLCASCYSLYEELRELAS